MSSENIVSSKSEARRIIKNKGIRINDVVIINDKIIINKKTFKENNFIKISNGKKKRYIIKSI